jgi:hypothetical protein
MKRKESLVSSKVAKGDINSPSQDIQSYEVEMEINPSATLISRPLDAAGDLNKAIDITLEARASFAGGVLIPVVLMLAVTAATFFDAYNALGATKIRRLYWHTVFGTPGSW